MIAWFKAWFFQSMLDELELAHAREILESRDQAFKNGYLQGRAVGQLEGQQDVLEKMSRFFDERRAELPEVTAADIERAKKGLVH